VRLRPVFCWEFLKKKKKKHKKKKKKNSFPKLPLGISLHPFSDQILTKDMAGAPGANACLGCCQTDRTLQRCSRCKSAWFCNRACQVAAVKNGHKGSKCRSATAVNPQPAPDAARLIERFRELARAGDQARKAKTRAGQLAAVEKFKEASALGDRLGGAMGAYVRACADHLLADTLVRMGEMVAASGAACSCLRFSRSSGNISKLIGALTICGAVAKEAPAEMAKAERECRAQERLSGCLPSYGGIDLSQEGRIRLPTTPAALSLAYNEAAVALCDTALEAVGGRGSRAAADDRLVLTLHEEATARGTLALALEGREERQRSVDLLRQAVALMRQVVRAAPPGPDALEPKGELASWLHNLSHELRQIYLEGGVSNRDSDGMAGAEACMREALALSEETHDVALKQAVLTSLSNLSGRGGPVEPAEAAALRSRMNALYVQTGRSPDTDCAICLEPLEQPTDQEATGGNVATSDGTSSVVVLGCGHQFYRRCMDTWFHSKTHFTCPLCKKALNRFLDRPRGLGPDTGRAAPL